MTTVIQGNSNIIKQYVDSEKSALYTQYHGYHSGVDVSGKVVISPFPGTVLQSGQSSEGLTVIIQYDATHCILIGNLEQINVVVGQSVDTGQQIATAKKYIHVEYLTSVTSKWPVRLITGHTLYKNNPTDIVLNGYSSLTYNFQTVSQTSKYRYGSAEYFQFCTKECDKELSNNRGQ